MYKCRLKEKQIIILRNCQNNLMLYKKSFEEIINRVKTNYTNINF